MTAVRKMSIRFIVLMLLIMTISACGKKTGSDDRQILDDYLANEPYVKANVWEDIKVEPINVVIANAKK